MVSCANGLLSLCAVTRNKLPKGQFADTNHTVDADNAKATLPPAVNRGAADVPHSGDLAERVEFLSNPISGYIQISHASL